MQQLNKENLEFILVGSTLLGSGGGGAIKTGKEFIGIILQEDHIVNLIDDKSDDFAFVLADIGAISAIEEHQEVAIYNAFDVLSNYHKKLNGKGCKCLFPIETGPENTFAAIVAAARNKIDVFDGDGAGRAVPQIQLSSYAENNIAPAPAAITNSSKDALIVFCEGSADMDSLLRPITGTKQFGNSASLALFPGTVKELANGCVIGSISYSLYTGMLIEGLKNANKDLIERALPAVNKRNACLIGKGTVKKTTDTVAGAFDFGSVTVTTVEGDEITVFNQNENLIAYSTNSSEPLIVAPHSICFLRYDMSPITNAEIAEKDQIYLIAIESYPELMKNKVLMGFSILLNGMGYAGKTGTIHSNLEWSPLGSLLKSIQ